MLTLFDQFGWVQVQQAPSRHRQTIEKLFQFTATRGVSCELYLQDPGVEFDQATR
jgi:hypothetical protein